MNCVRFHLAINAQDYIAYYAGMARSVTVIADDGRRIEFPAEHLREFVTHQGVNGYFEIEFDQNHRFMRLRQIDSGEEFLLR